MARQGTDYPGIIGMDEASLGGLQVSKLANEKLTKAARGSRRQGIAIVETKSVMAEVFFSLPLHIWVLPFARRVGHLQAKEGDHRRQR